MKCLLFIIAHNVVFYKKFVKLFLGSWAKLKKIIETSQYFLEKKICLSFLRERKF